MKNLLRPLLALSLIIALGAGEKAHAAESSFGNASYGSQSSFDSFNYSVRKRLESVRIGSLGQTSYRSSPAYNEPAYNPGYSQGYNPGYNQQYNPNPGYNGGYNPTPGYNGGYNPTPAYNGGYNPTPQPYGTTVNSSYNPNSFGTNGYSYNFSSDEAYAMAPSSRTSSVASARRRQLDCVYYSGFTVWADLYQTWARQRSRGNEDGYKFRTFGPALGFDYTTGPVTVGAAMTYNWGKLKGRDTSHDMKLHTWALELYGQYNTDLFYVNGTLAYAHNRYRSNRTNFSAWNWGNNSDRFSTNSFNIDAEFGWKLNWSGLQVIPYAGLRYFHDRRGSIDEGGWDNLIHASSKNYHTLEMPIGVNVAYEINTGGMVFVPRARFAWVPELSRKRGSWSGSYSYNDGAGNWTTINNTGENSARRSRHGFLLGLGMEAKLSKSLSAHIDYNVNFRSKQYEHHWNLGMGFSF